MTAQLGIACFYTGWDVNGRGGGRNDGAYWPGLSSFRGGVGSVGGCHDAQDNPLFCDDPKKHLTKKEKLTEDLFLFYGKFTDKKGKSKQIKNLVFSLFKRVPLTHPDFTQSSDNSVSFHLS